MSSSLLMEAIALKSNYHRLFEHVKNKHRRYDGHMEKKLSIVHRKLRK